jgi:pimeloyl-ACP methyl ester carboxylesterase
VQKTKSATLVLLLALATLPATIPFVPTVSAATPAYTEINGSLNGANYTVRFPASMNDWNRILVVYCHGYSHTEPTRPLIKTSDGTENWSNGTLLQGSAFAMSSYGAGGYCVQKGMNATYELTQYIISTYKVAKVYLVGLSMGAKIALLLGEKYPKVYGGVIDISGGKNTTDLYNRYATIAAMTNDTELAAYIQSTGAPVPPYPFSLYPPPLSSQFNAMRNFFGNGSADIATELGGTPNAVPEAYQASDPVYHANISIPVISVHGTADFVVPYYQSLQYQAAVAANGKSSLYRLYKVDSGQHVDATVQTTASMHMMDLASMALQLRPLLRATAFSNVTMLTGWTWWFFAQTTGNVGTLKYQWYEGSTLLSGQTSVACPVTKNAPGKYEYYCQITDTDGVTINTNTITLTVVS